MTMLATLFYNCPMSGYFIRFHVFILWFISIVTLT